MVVSWDQWTLDVPARRLVGADGAVHVEPQVFDVLAYLLAHRDRVVGKAELLDNIWGDQFVSESALTSRIKSVRRALGDDGKTQRYIRNVHGRGYQFVGEVNGTGETPLVSASQRAATPHGAPHEALIAHDLAGAIAVDDEFPFVGREEELALIGAELAAGRGFIALGGEPGIGKSRLAIEALERAVHRGVLVCAGRCEEHVRYPLQPILDAISELAEQRSEAFAGWATGLEPQLVALVPGLIGSFDVDPQPVDGYAAMDVLASVIEQAAMETPLILLVDDVHWSDDPTRALLARVVRRLRDRPFAAVATFRSTALDLPGDVWRWIDQQVRTARGLRLDLTGLSTDAARELVGRVVPGRADAETDRLLAATRGHGLFLTEALRDLQMGRDGGGSVRDVVVARAGLLSADGLALVRAGSTLGSEFPYDLAVAGAGLDAARGLHAVDEAIAAGLLHETESPSRFRFSHQLVADAIRTSMPSIVVAGIHQRSAATLVAAGGDQVDIGHHLLGAVPLVALDEAVATSRAAAADALARHQFERGERLLDHVLALPIDDRQRAEVLVQAGSITIAAGRTVLAAPRFEEAANLARRHGWTDVLADAALGHLGRSPYRRLLDTSTLDLLREADAALGDQPSVRKAKVLAKTAVFSQFALPLDECDAMARRALAMAPDASEEDRIDLLEARAILLTCPIGLDEYEVVYGELADLLARHQVFEADAATAETVYYARGRGSELREVARMVERRAEGHAISEWRDITLAAMLAAFAGDLDLARQRYDESGSIGEQYWGDSAHVLHGLGHLFVGALGGGWERACDLFDTLLLFDRNQHLVTSAAWAHLAAGHRERGLELAGEIRIESLRWHGEHILGGNTLVAAAEVAVLTGDDGLAAAVAAELERFPHLMLGLPWACSLAASHALARLAQLRGDDEAAQRHAASAADLYERIGAPAVLDLLRCSV